MNIKHIYYLLIYLNCLFVYPAYSQFTFNKYYPSGNLSGANYIEETTPNNYLVYGSYKDSLTNNQGFELFKLNSLGNITIKKRYQYIYEVASFFSTNHILNFNEQKLYVTSGITTASNNAVLFMCINKNTLDTFWCKKVLDNYDYYVHQISKVASNEIWLMGTRASNTSSLTPIILKYDTLGNLLSTREYTTLINYECFNIEYDPVTTRLYFAGNNFNTNPTGYNLTCMDTTGYVYWDYNIKNDGLFFKTIRVVNNELWCVGKKMVSNYYTNGEHKLVFCKYNKLTGISILCKTYGGAYNNNLLTSFTHLPNNEILFCGTYSVMPYVSGYDRNGVLLKTKTNGDSLWLRTFGNLNNVSYEMFLDAKPTSDGGFITCGTPIFAPAPTSQSWIVKTDSSGNAPGLIVVGLNDKSILNQVQLYPNPFNDIINIKMQQSIKIEIEVKNAIGQIVLKECDISSDIKLDLKNQAPGFYFITLISNHQQITTKVIKL
ncbi:MAG: T9SS type A sorting domain-containing protein [Bacteroidetes bacterium]|nr:T9SS type A sorting domain-containing protein [Bacteroidota bacterium]